jgi:hypothetical protein
VRHGERWGEHREERLESELEHTSMGGGSSSWRELRPGWGLGAMASSRRAQSEMGEGGPTSRLSASSGKTREGGRSCAPGAGSKPGQAGCGFGPPWPCAHPWRTEECAEGRGARPWSRRRGTGTVRGGGRARADAGAGRDKQRGGAATMESQGPWRESLGWGEEAA